MPPGRRKGRVNLRFKRDPVVLSTNRGYMLLAGELKLTAAKQAGETTLECTVKDEGTPQERCELFLTEMYFSSLAPAMDLGRAFVDYRDTYGMAQQELGRRTGITAGTIHHYESLVRCLDPGLGDRLNSGELTFKEARAIADIKDHARQREIAQPFIEGLLSSRHVERIVMRAKAAADLSVEQIISDVFSDRPAPEPEPVRVVQPAIPVEFDTDLIENAVLKIAGELDALQHKTIPEYRRLKLVSSLRILDTRTKSAMAKLNGGAGLFSQAGLNSHRVGMVS